jgi:hypothetical protein
MALISKICWESTETDKKCLKKRNLKIIHHLGFSFGQTIKVVHYYGYSEQFYLKKTIKDWLR